MLIDYTVPTDFNQPIISIVIKQEPEKPEPKTHSVVKGDNLTKISEAFNVPVQRLWEANPELAHPDVLNVGETIKIPLNTDVLTAREMPVTIQAVAPTLKPISKPLGGFSSKGSSSGNTYTYGYCTWGVKVWRPDIPNGLGNASTWYSRASAMGMSVGSTPRVGAVAQQGNHVALVIGVSGNTVTLKEMNYVGWNIASTRTAPASNFHYIY